MLYIDGAFESAADTFALVDPTDGRTTGTVPEASAAHVDRAVAAARRALGGPWGEEGVEGRRAVLRRIADGIEARFDEFVAAEVADTGKPRELAATVDIPRAVGNFRAYADLLYGRAEEAYPTAAHGWNSGAALSYTLRRPLGVVAVVAPWNLPLLLLTWKVAPALAMGNTVVAKPSELTPRTATLLAEVIDAAGVPAGVFNLVHGAAATGAHLVAHPGVDAIAFTGATATGRTIMGAAAANLTPVSFELGGKNAAVVFADADLDAAVAGTVRSSFTHAGQICLCTERVYVQRPVYDRFVRALAERTRALRPGVDYGPMISAGHRAKVLGHFRLAEEEGATVEVGGRAMDQGFFVEPTVLTGLGDDTRTVREEIFGPVCHVAPFDTEAEVVGRVNDSEYGLAATVWTTDLSRAHRVAARIEAGIVWVNCWNLRDLRTPFGGLRSSGIGREGGAHSLDFFSEPVTVCVGIGAEQ
ncbi:aldehyde dehydrogenase family protein [Longispora sp. NPDC051575]|uniref:aldehyde dehydrogenase family protein n=1 Tax=Longispora sp. NPDC051575 TaxID=3154943 RepID=UPI0034255000